jgi:hypothetical protein
LCACPPIVAVTATVAVPSARHAVHRLTESKPAHRPKRLIAHKPADPCPELRAGAPTAADILSALGGTDTPSGPELTSLTITTPPGPTDVGFGGTVVGPTGPVSFGGGGGPLGPFPPLPPGPPGQTTPIPELSSWLMMVGGFGAIGMLIRYRSRKSARWKLSGAALGTAGELAGGAKLLLGSAATAATPHASAVASHSFGAALVKGASVCVCTGAIMATAVTTVPPIKRAVYAATMPAPPPALHTDCRV